MTAIVRAAAFATALLTLLTACSEVTFFAANAPAWFGPYRRETNLAYGKEPRQRLDVYTPRSAARRPVVVFFYGGSWTMGSKSQYRFVGAALASRGFVTVIPDYRLYPPARFPLFMQDAAQAVAWVRQHAAELGADPDMIVLMGHSAGAHMAALLALDETYLQAVGVDRHSIAALVGLSGPYALDPNTDTLRTIFGPPSTAADWQPVRFASGNAPPALLLHGLDDKVVYVMHTERLRDALLAAGASPETHLYPGRGHADTIASFTLLLRHRTPAFAQTVDFLTRLQRQRNDPSH